MPTAYSNTRIKINKRPQTPATVVQVAELVTIASLLRHFPRTLPPPQVPRPQSGSPLFFKDIQN